MGILDGILGPALTVATQAAGAHQQGQEQASKILQALRMQQASMDEKASVMRKNDADALATTHKNRAPVLGEPGYADAQGDVAGAEANAKVPAAVRQATQVAPINEATHLANRKADAANPTRDNSDRFTFTSAVGPDGKSVIAAGNTRTGQVTPTSVGKPEGGGLGGATQQRQRDYVHLMEQSLPEMQRLEPNVRPFAVSAALKHPTFVNAMLTPDEQQYIMHFKNFLAGVLHQESGARLTDSQIAWGAQRFGTMMGDDSTTRTAKLQMAQKLMDDRNREAGASSGPIDQSAGKGQPGPKGDDVDAKIAALKAQGLGPKEIKAKLVAEGYQ